MPVPTWRRTAPAWRIARCSYRPSSSRHKRRDRTSGLPGKGSPARPRSSRCPCEIGMVRVGPHLWCVLRQRARAIRALVAAMSCKRTYGLCGRPQVESTTRIFAERVEGLIRLATRRLLQRFAGRLGLRTPPHARVAPIWARPSGPRPNRDWMICGSRPVARTGEQTSAVFCTRLRSRTRGSEDD
jgi:hypothetical protein